MLENNDAHLKQHYSEYGYCVIRNYFDKQELAVLRDIILTFHDAWKKDNKAFYQDDAFNSSLITGSQYLNDSNRIQLFNFISSHKMMKVIDTLIPNSPAFMNTQLFFDPYNPQQKTFWHRDCQYDHDVDDQKTAIKETQVMHLRVPLFDELGIELIPGTHKRWDTAEELSVRLEEDNRHSYEELPNSQQIKLSAGDVLLFSADMIHRGVYGLNRLALDILVFDPSGDFADYVDDDCLPNEVMLQNITNSRLFKNTIRLKTPNKVLC